MSRVVQARRYDLKLRLRDASDVAPTTSIAIDPTDAAIRMAARVLRMALLIGA
jgi:hypothetical protein